MKEIEDQIELHIDMLENAFAKFCKTFRAVQQFRALPNLGSTGTIVKMRIEADVLQRTLQDLNPILQVFERLAIAEDETKVNQTFCAACRTWRKGETE